MTPSAALHDRVARLMGARPVLWKSIARGYTLAGRWIVRCADGRSAFVKVGTTPETATWLRTEHRFYSGTSADFLPALLGWDDSDGEPILLLEDLSDALWPPPWPRDRVERVLEALAAVVATPPPAGLPPLTASRDALRGWSTVAEDPTQFLSMRFCSAAWLEAALPTLLAAESAAQLAGTALVHLDVRSDNICFQRDRVVLIDWNWACVGNPRMDLAGWLPSLAAEGGPRPVEILPDEPELAALMSGYFAARVGLPPPESAPRVRPLQVAQLRHALPWAAAVLSLPDPDLEADRAFKRLPGG